MYTEEKKILNRLRRSEGQLRGIQKMVIDDKNHVEVITQLSAVRASINRIMSIILSSEIDRLTEAENDHITFQEYGAELKHALDIISKK